MTWWGHASRAPILTLVIRRRSGEVIQVPMTCRLDTAEEVSVYEAGGVLQRFAQDFLASTAQRPQAKSQPRPFEKGIKHPPFGRGLVRGNPSSARVPFSQRGAGFP